MYNQIIHYPKVLIASEPSFDLYVGYQQPRPGVLMNFVHLDVYQFTANTLRHFKSIWSEIRPTLGPIVFCIGHTDDKKFHKFCTHFGWSLISQTPCSDGNTRRIYVNYL